MIDKLQILKNIVGIDTPTPIVDERDIIGDLEISRMEEWDKNTSSDLKPDRRLALFHSEIESNFRHTPVSTPKFWEIKEKLYSNAGMNAKETISQNIQRKIDRFETIDEKLNYAADNAKTWPSYVTQEQLIPTLIQRQEQKSKLMFDARLNSSLSFGNMLDNMVEEQSYLNPRVSMESHGEDLIKAFLYGYDSSLSEDGRVQIALDGQPQDVWTLPTPEASVMERLIASSDLQPMIKKLRPLLDMSRDKAKEEDRLVTLSKFNRLTEIPEEFQIPVLVDGAMLSNDPEFSTQEGISRIMERKTKLGKYNSPQSFCRDYFKLMAQVTEYVESKGITNEGENTNA
jgi:hypothetical protein